jgi:hypothetical protein
MSQENLEWFIAERARALAIVYLTRRSDLAIKKAGVSVGLEFLVYISKYRPALERPSGTIP